MKKNTSLRYNIIKVFVIVIIPLVCLSYGIVFNAKQVVEKQAIQLNQDALSLYAKQTEDRLYYMSTYLSNFISRDRTKTSRSL